MCNTPKMITAPIADQNEDETQTSNLILSPTPIVNINVYDNKTLSQIAKDIPKCSLNYEYVKYFVNFQKVWYRVVK